MHFHGLREPLVVAAIMLAISQEICQAQTAPPHVLRTSQFDQRVLETVVSIERRPSPDKEIPVGTGFIVRSSRNHLILVTAKHVVIDADEKLVSDLVYRLNRIGGSTQLVRDADLAQIGVGSWFLSPQHDLAVRFLPIVQESPVKAIPLDRFVEEPQVEAGTPLAALGFPMGLRSVDHYKPIARRGMVGRADPLMVLADLFVFPGNSGGPVVYVPMSKTGDVSTDGAEIVHQEMLVGVVSSFIPYKDVAVSEHTKRPRVVFEENSGLANLVPAWIVKAFITTGDVMSFDETLSRKR